MKKNKRIPLIVVLLIIATIGFVIFKLVGNKEDKSQKLAKIYEELNDNQTYLFEMEQNSSNKKIMAKKGNKTIIDLYSKDSETKIEDHRTTLVTDNITYLILHNREEYYVYEQANNVEQNILTDSIKDVADREYTTGEEKVRGKKYKYEEYNGLTEFMLANIFNINEEDIKTRFYFDNNGNLTYIKTIYGEESELLKVKLENNVDDSLFEIPANYAEN